MKIALLALALLASVPAVAQTSWRSASVCGATAQVPDHSMADNSGMLGDGTYQIRLYSESNQTFGLACVQDGPTYGRMEDRQAVSAAVFVLFGHLGAPASFTDVAREGRSGRAFVFQPEPDLRMHFYGYRTSSDTVVFAIFGATATVDPDTAPLAQRFLDSLTL